MYVFAFKRDIPWLTHCKLVDSSTVTCWMSQFVILGSPVYVAALILFLMENNVYPDQMPHCGI